MVAPSSFSSGDSFFLQQRWHLLPSEAATPSSFSSGGSSGSVFSLQERRPSNLYIDREVNFGGKIRMRLSRTSSSSSKTENRCERKAGATVVVLLLLNLAVVAGEEGAAVLVGELNVMETVVEAV